MAGWIRRHRAETEVVQTLDERGLVLLLAGAVHVAVRRRGPDRAKDTSALRVTRGAARRVAGSAHAAPVELVTGDRRRIEVGRREVRARVKIGGEVTAVAGRIEDVAVRELRMIRGRSVLEEVSRGIRVLLPGHYAPG